MWTKTYGNSFYNWGRNLDLTSDGGFIVVGSTALDETGFQNIWLLKINNGGDTLWTKTYCGNENAGGYSVQEVSDEGFIITGYITDSSGNTDICLIKTDNNGNQEWLKRYGGSEYEIALYVSETSDNGFVISGHTYSYGMGESDVYILKTDINGDTLWTKTYGGGAREGFSCVKETSDGGYIFTGQSISFGPGGQDVWLMKTDSQGDVEWERFYGGGSDESAYWVEQLSDGGYILTAFNRSKGVAGSEDFWLVKTDGSGNIEWDKTFGGAGMDHPQCVCPTNDGGYILTGYTDSFGSGGQDIWVVKTDSEGNEIWNKLLGGSSNERGYAIQQTANGEYFIAGLTESFGNGSGDVWLIKLESDLNRELVAYYPFNGNANDESGNGNNGTVNGAILTTDRFGNGNCAYEFDGLDDFLTIQSNDLLNLSGDFTITLWLYPEVNMMTTNSHGVISKIETDAEGKDGYVLGHLHESSDNIVSFFSVYDTDNVSTNLLSIKKWCNITVTHMLDTLSIYVDGILHTKNAGCASPVATVVPLVFGRWYGNHDDYYFNGKIDDTYIYNYALSKMIIDSLYHIGGWDLQTDSGLVAYYPFNGNANDESGKGNYGTVNGATLTTDRFGNENSAFNFDGIDDYIEIQNDGDFDNQEFTITAWVKWEYGSTNKGGIFNNGFNVDHYALCADSSGITIWTNWPTSDQTGTMYLTKILKDQQFHFLAARYNGQKREILIDGDQVHEDDFIEIIDYSILENCFIGVNFPGNDEYFRGVIDDVRLFSKALTNNEIKLIQEDKDIIPPSYPQSLIADSDYNSVMLTWGKNRELDLLGYNIYRSTNNISYNRIDSIYGFPADTFYADAAIVNGTNYWYKITAVDTNRNESEFSNIVSARPGDYTAPVVNIITPGPGFSIPEYMPLTVTWTASDNIAMDSIQIIYSNDANGSQQVVCKVPADSSQFVFDVPAGVTDQAIVSLRAWDTSGNDTLVHSPYFKVTDNTPPEVALLTQLHGSEFAIGSMIQIEWIATDNVEVTSIDLLYSTDLSGWKSIFVGEENDGEYQWLIPNDPSDQCQLKVVAHDAIGIAETISGYPFSIVIEYPYLASAPSIISQRDSIWLHFTQAIDTDKFPDGISINSNVIENPEVQYKFDDNNRSVALYCENTFVSADTLLIVLAADQVTNVFGYGLDGNHSSTFEGAPVDNDTVEVIVRYSADFDANDQINWDDLVILSDAWYSRDYRYELGPVIGDPPHFQIASDSLFNIEDAMTFGRMWNWQASLGKRIITMPQTFVGSDIITEQIGNTIVVHSSPVSGKRVVVQYDSERITVCKKETQLSKPSEMTFNLYAECPDSERVEFVSYSFDQNPVDDPVSFIINSKERYSVDVKIGFEGINANGELVQSSVSIVQFQPVPDKFELYSNYPNPFNSSTVIEYAIPEKSNVSVEIYDLRGYKVRSLVDSP
ncbi:MAG: LamG-like jellyroll fold domain-containing protein, partial [bacterium]